MFVFFPRGQVERPWFELSLARFAARIAEWLTEALAQKRYDELRIAAAPRFLGQLRKALDKQVASVVAEESSKDLTHEGAKELTARFFPPRRTT